MILFQMATDAERCISGLKWSFTKKTKKISELTYRRRALPIAAAADHELPPLPYRRSLQRTESFTDRGGSSFFQPLQMSAKFTSFPQHFSHFKRYNSNSKLLPILTFSQQFISWRQEQSRLEMAQASFNLQWKWRRQAFTVEMAQKWGQFPKGNGAEMGAKG
jgi:hypothetical protein